MEFLDDPSGGGEAGGDQGDVGLAVFLRATHSSRPDSITGIRCFMGMGGAIRVETRGVPGADAKVEGVVPGGGPPALRLEFSTTGGQGSR